jgi:serine/threonine-protein kinase
VWALGVTLYLHLTDRFPFADSGQTDLSSAMFARPLIPPSRLNGQVDPFLDQVVFKALSVQPEQRYPSAKELLDDLLKWQPRGARTERPKFESSSDTSKIALGAHSSPDEARALQMARKAVDLAKQVARLPEAADLMEEAFNKWPPLREEYEGRVQLWRRGIVM